MNPHEQRLRDEVIYLHSLWHQGPPTPRTNFNLINPNPNPNPNPTHNTSRLLQPSNPTQFKRDRKTPRAKKGRKAKNWPTQSDSSPVSDVEWPCTPPVETPPATTCGWPSLKLHSNPTTRLASAEEQARFAAKQVQQKALKATQEFFAGHVDSDDSDDDCEDEVDLMDDDGCEEYKFFLKVFMEDNELRGYYEKNYENGEFCCLVCGGIGQKVGKRFRDCVALVQHSTAIAKTKKKRAHRAYGQAICNVLGWDIDRLPTIVLSLGDPLARALTKSGELQGNANDGAKDGSNVIGNNVDSVNADNIDPFPNNDCNARGDLPGKTGELPNSVAGELMVCENYLTVADTKRSTDDLDNGIPDILEGNAEGVVNCLSRNLSRRMVLEI